MRVLLYFFEPEFESFLHEFREQFFVYRVPRVIEALRLACPFFNELDEVDAVFCCYRLSHRACNERCRGLFNGLVDFARPYVPEVSALGRLSAVGMLLCERGEVRAFS